MLASQLPERKNIARWGKEHAYLIGLLMGPLIVIMNYDDGDWGGPIYIYIYPLSSPQLLKLPIHKKQTPEFIYHHLQLVCV